MCLSQRPPCALVSCLHRSFFFFGAASAPRSLTELKRNLLAAPFDRAFDALREGRGGSLPPSAIPWRKNEVVYIVPQVRGRARSLLLLLLLLLLLRPPLSIVVPFGDDRRFFPCGGDGGGCGADGNGVETEALSFILLSTVEGREGSRAPRSLDQLSRR